MADVPSEARIAHAIAPYRDVLVRFVVGAMSADEFEPAYLGIYLADETIHSQDVFDVVDGFFADVDAYVADPRLRDASRDELGEDQLRQRAVKLLQAAGVYQANPTIE